VLTALSQLSVESNQLCSLQGVEGMTALMELYAANNRIGDIKVG
jgi:Leucine-rich repeat (LRR) protein